MSSSQQREEEQQSVSSSSSQVHLHGGQEGANTQLTDDEQQRAVEALLPSPPRTPDGTLGAAQSNVDGTVRSYHFPSQPNASASSRSSPPRASPLHTTVTVADLRTKSCWICSEEDEDRPTFAQSSSSAEGLPGTQRRETPVRGRRRFVHPCRCTLVAHESVSARHFSEWHFAIVLAAPGSWRYAQLGPMPIAFASSELTLCCHICTPVPPSMDRSITSKPASPRYGSLPAVPSTIHSHRAQAYRVEVL